MKMCRGLRPSVCVLSRECPLSAERSGSALSLPSWASRAERVRMPLDTCGFLRMSASVPPGHNWTRQVKKEEGDEEDPLDQLITRSGCAASHFAVQECMAQHQDWRQCQPQVQAFRDCMSAQQARRREELQRRKEQASAQH